MLKSGIMVNKLSISQLGYCLIESVNKAVGNGLDIIVFYEDWDTTPAIPRFCTLMEREIWGLDGVAIATDLKTARRLLKCTGPTKKYLYVWNLEWLQQQNLPFESAYAVYMDPNLELIAKSEYHAKLLEKVWKKPAFIMEDFNPKVLRQILSGGKLTYGDD